MLQRDFPSVLPEVRARAADRGLPPLEPPPGWPMETWSLDPLRAAVFACDKGRGPELARAAFRHVFVASRSLSDPEVLGDAASDAGLDPAEMAEAIRRPEIKERLKEHTNGALERGITGIPTVEIGNELFWGDDHLEEATAAAAARS